MAEDVEILSEERIEEADREVVEIVVAVSSSNNDISSTESSVDCIIDVVSTDCQSPAFTTNDLETFGVSSVQESSAVSSNVEIGDFQRGCTSRKAPPVAPASAPTSSQSAYGTESCKLPTSSTTVESAVINPASCASQCTSECDCEIIVDDVPTCSTDQSKCSHTGLGQENGQACRKAPALPDDGRFVRYQGGLPTNLCIAANGNRRGLCVRSRSATPSPSFKCHTPNSPGTAARQRSVSGSFYSSPSPRPLSNPGTPGERQRAGSMGEIELRERVCSRENGVRIIDHLDISQLPRPRNPGGVLPQNGHPLPQQASNNEALDLIVTPRPKRKCNDGLQQGSLFTQFISTPVTSNSSAATTKNSHSNYLISNLIRTTPTKVNKVSVISVPFGTSNTNHLRGWTSSINESVERPKPSSEVDSEGVAKKIARLGDDSLMCSSSEDSLWQSRVPGHTETQVWTPPERPKPPRRRFTPVPENLDGSNDRFISPSRSRRRNNSPQASSALHPSVSRVTPQGVLRAYKCSMCEFTTTEKAQLRRHRRLHHRSTPVNILKCGKCSYTSLFPRKMREHYHQVHHDSGTPGMVTEITESAWLPPQRYMGSRAVDHLDGVGSSYPGPYYSHTDPMLYDRGDRAGYTYSGRQHGLNYPIEPFSVSPYPDVRGRQADQMASNYLRSIVSSIINSESNLRQPPSSTITSSSYFMSPVTTEAVPHPNNCTTNDTCRSDTINPLDIKVKVEPDIDDSSDISSTANSHNAVTPDLQRHLVEPNVPFSESHLTSHTDIANGNADSSMTIEPSLSCHTNVPYTSSLLPHQATDLRRPRKSCDNVENVRDLPVPSTSNEGQNASMSGENISATNVNGTSVKCDTVSRGIQCVLPVIKTEIDLDGDYYDFYGGHRFRFHGVDRAVQCDVISRASSPVAGSAPPRSQLLPQPLADPAHSMSESEPSEHHSSMSGDSRCEHCGISFDDDVIFSIHIGCHSHTDPFKCNVCGKQCGNKYVFYSHIMRGHQF